LQEEIAQFIEPSRQRTADYLTAWLQHQTRRLKPKTLASNQSCIDRYLIPALGRTPLAELSPRAVQAVWDDLADAGLTRTARLSRAVFRKALADAVRLGHLAFNVVDRTTAPPPVPRRPVTPYTLAEVEALMAAALPRWRPLFTFAAWTGLRLGELCALQWPDWDPAARTLTVGRNLVVVHNRPLVQDTPKTRAGFRTLTLPARAQAALEAQRAWVDEARAAAGTDWRDEGWVFCTRTGQLLRPRNVQRVYTRARTAAGLPAQPFHGLRHFAVSVQLSAGIPLELVAKRIGHQNRALTADLYGHLLRDLDAAATRQLDDWAARRAEQEAATANES
jgi:integrase